MEKKISNMVCLLSVVLMVLVAATGCVLKYNPETGDVATEITMTTDEFLQLYDAAMEWINARDIDKSKVFIINDKRIRLIKE
jgi:hypothetical protein